MRFVLAVAMMAATPAMACNTEMLTIEDGWTVEEVDSFAGFRNAGLSLIYTNAGDRAFRLIDATVQFQDALGAGIGSIQFDRDTGLAPGESAALEGTYAGDNLLRLNSMNPDDIVITTCVRSVVYVDGKREEF